MQDKFTELLPRQKPKLSRSCAIFYVEVWNTNGETYSEIDDLLPSSLRQSRCLWTSATPSASRQPASTSALGGARALPSPVLTIHELDTLVEVEEVAAVELVEQITRCSSVQFGGNVQLTNCMFNINIMMKK